MQIRSRKGKRTIKLYENERRQLETAAALCRELSQLADEDLAKVSASADVAISKLLDALEPELVEANGNL